MKVEKNYGFYDSPVNTLQNMPKCRETATTKLFKDLKEEIKLFIKDSAILRKIRFIN